MKSQAEQMLDVIKLAEEFHKEFEWATFRKDDIDKAIKFMLTGEISIHTAENYIWQIIANLDTSQAPK